MRLLLLTAALGFAGMTAAGLAESAPEPGKVPSPVLVELYTSQGCSSCPPADALLTEIAALPGVIALALHVDYWDYLGWKDTYADPRHSDRQRAYAKRAGSRTIFTPQIVVQGMDRVKGHNADKVRAAIEARRSAAERARLAVAREGDMVRIDLAPGDRAVAAAAVQVATYLPSQAVAIQSGENAGRDITYSNVVTSWETVGEWDGAGPVQIVYRVPAAGPVVVIVQEIPMGPVLTAARLP